MIYDFGTESTCAHPDAGTHRKTCTTNCIDISAGSDGSAFLFGAGERLYMQFEVTEAFATSNAAVANFGIAIDDTGSAPSLSASAYTLALTGGSMVGSPTHIGYRVDELTLGTTFHLAIPSWEDIMCSIYLTWPKRKDPGDLAKFRDFRWMGPIIVVPNYREATASTGFTAGEIKSRIVMNPTGSHLSHTYGSRMAVL